ncbi:MAG: hypothetical protein EBR30_05360 [Cytophagia bacterium]|nr:hypothetical protein [Cytophagia bacterium]
MKKLILFLFSLNSFSLLAQSTATSLTDLKLQFDDSFRQKRQKVSDYILQHKVPVRFNDLEGNTLELVDIDENGRPIYLTTFNAGLALTTGVTKLRIDGNMGLNLKGEGMIAGIWDGGSVFQHLEFGNRSIFTEGAAISDHGTHVAGSVLAAGVNIGAGGMAPLAKYYSFDWNSDRSEMVSLAKSDESSLLFSNHSYGLVQGWVFQNNSWTWTGNASISTLEDWRFGFYTSVARDLDQIASNAPYYSIFWAAGNDRDDTGGALYPADGNQGSGYDCLAQEGTAKNIFTIGAIQKIADYAGPQSVVMSGFSGWGPTDDGRIKPDLVAPGVGIFSPVSGNSYASFNGTSMASPGAMGSLMLVQELHKKLNGGKPMLSATLKALAIHTAKEAGGFPGPDYSFGWGVVDVEHAAKLLLQQDNRNVIVKELELEQNGSYELTLNPKLNTKITVTIAWTDPAGSPPSPSLDPATLMLVNDLDMRILNSDQVVGLPWVLNPAVVSLSEPATKGDNFRDNVEKIEFEATEEAPHKLLINHKNQLMGGKQNFSLIISYESTNPLLTDYYWVGGSGAWDNANNWSAVSGGIGGFGVPNQMAKAIFDEKSLNSGDIITLSNDQYVGSLLWLNSKQSTIKTNLKNIIIGENILIASDSLQIEDGSRVIIDGSLSGEKRLGFSSNKFENTTLVLNEGSSYELSGTVSLDSLILVKGNLTLKSDTLNISVLNVLDQSSSVDISNAVISNVRRINFNSTTQLLSANSFILPAVDAEIDFADLRFDGTLLVNNSGLVISGNNQIESIKASQPFSLTGSNTIKNLVVNAGGSLKLDENTVQTLPGLIEFNSTSASPISLEAISGNASLYLEERRKLCFDNLRIYNINITGEAIVNAGISSQLTNAVNWEKDICENVLFPDFTFNVNCVGSLIALNDLSEGLVTERKWTVPSTADLIEANDGKTYLIAKETGVMEILLQIENASSTRVLSKTINIVENNLPTNSVVINGNNLFSVKTSTSYQWFKDFEPIPNATGRNFNYSGTPGLYFVLTESEGCNRISSEALINELEKELQIDALNLFWPNPAEKKLYFSKSVVSAKIISLSGIVLQELAYTENEDNEYVILDSQQGIVILEMTLKNGLVVREKLIIK